MVACCLLFAEVNRLFFAALCVTVVLRCLWFVVRGSLFVVRCVLRVVRGSLCVACCLLLACSVGLVVGSLVVRRSFLFVRC